MFEMHFSKLRESSSNETKIMAWHQKLPLVSVCFLQGARAAQTRQRQLPEAAPGPEVLGRRTMSHRDVVHLSSGCLARTQSGETIGVGGTPEAKRHLQQHDPLFSFIIQRMCGAYVCPRTRDRCLMLTHVTSKEIRDSIITIVRCTCRRAEYCRKFKYNVR